MDQLLLKLGSFLVTDKANLSKWIQGIQQNFSQFYISSRKLSESTKELEILKEFLAIKIEQLQLRLQELLNEQEDLKAMNTSSVSIKEHLLSQVHDLDQKNTLKSTELLIKSQRVQELEQVEVVEMLKRNKEQQEMKQFKKEVSKEVKQLRKETDVLKSQNLKYRKSLLSLKLYMDKMMGSNADDILSIGSSGTGGGGSAVISGSFVDAEFDKTISFIEKADEHLLDVSVSSQSMPNTTE